MIATSVTLALTREQALGNANGHAEMLDDIDRCIAYLEAEPGREI